MRISTKDEHEYINTHATIEKQFKDITKQEFDEFIASYPRHLEYKITGKCRTYYDYEIGRCANGKVASTSWWFVDDRHEKSEERYRIVTNYGDIYKESQRLLREYKRKQLHKELLDEFEASAETDYAHWLEYKMEIVYNRYAKQISWQEGQRNAIVEKFYAQINAYSAWLKLQISKVIIDSMGVPIYESIEKDRAYKDCMLEFDKIFYGDRNDANS